MKIVLFDFVVIIAAAIGLAALTSWITMLLWNALCPDIFGLPLIDFWQAFGLLLLSSIFFYRPGIKSKRS